jgi:hypothetical protein
MKNLKVYRFGNIAPTLKCEMGTIIREPETLEPRALVEPRVKLKPPVSRQQLLQHTEDDPKGAEEFLEFLRKSRRDRQERDDLG